MLVPDEAWRVSMPAAGHDLLAVSPVLVTARGGLAVAPLGLVDVLNAGGAVLGAELAAAVMTGGGNSGGQLA